MAMIEISVRLKEKVEGFARDKGIPVEELIAIALNRTFSILNPEDVADMHIELCDKYLREAEEFLREKDGVQASEKGWGAASQAIKAKAAKEGKELRSHGELWKYGSELRRRYKDEEIGVLWDRANSLHMNFYENWLPLDDVEVRIRDIKRFIEKMKDFMR